MKKVIIFGVGEFGRLACFYLNKDSSYQVAAFTAHQEYITEREIYGLNVVPFEQLTKTHPPEEYLLFIAVGYSRLNKARAEIYAVGKTNGYSFISYFNSKATQWGEIEIGDNCFIFENNVIQPFVKIGNDTIIWSGNHIGHNVAIGRHCFIASHAVIAGNVKIGDYCFIGINATIREGICVASGCLIGAGAVILSDTKENEIYAVKGTEPAVINSAQFRGFK